MPSDPKAVIERAREGAHEAANSLMDETAGVDGVVQDRVCADTAMRSLLTELRDGAELQDMGEYGLAQTEVPWEAYVIDARLIDELLKELDA